MKVKFIEHAKERLTDRGTSEEEIKKVYFWELMLRQRKAEKLRR
jgi:hypothetical protein